MPLTQPHYLPRIIDRKISDYLKLFGAILLEGPKWCGKTWTVLNHAESVTYLMDPVGNYSTREAAEINPASALQGDRPHAIDEWQEVPAIWDAVRFEVDQHTQSGVFLLTGSTRPRATKEKSPRHSGAGRFARIRMRPLSLYESADSTGEISLASLLEGEPVKAFSTPADVSQLIQLATRGGWPENQKVANQQAGIIAREYLQLLASSDISDIDSNEPKHDETKVTALLRAFARSTATIITNATLQRDTQSGTQSLSHPTVAAYMDALSRLFVIEELPGWRPQIRSKARITTTPKRLFVDPSLAVAGLQTSPQRLARDLPTFGNIFENLCLRDLLVYANALEGSVHHFRDSNGLEVDAIIELPDGRYGAFEIKLNAARAGEATHTLLRFRDKMLAGGADAPSCLTVITGGGIAKTDASKVSIVPITALCP